MFYQTLIESILTLSFTCWFGGLSVEDKNSLFSIRVKVRVVKICSKIIGVQQSDLTSLWERQMFRKAKGIFSQSSHTLSSEFTMMPLRMTFYSTYQEDY